MITPPICSCGINNEYGSPPQKSNILMFKSMDRYHIVGIDKNIYIRDRVLMDGGESRFHLGEEGNLDFANSSRDKEIL